MAVRECRQEKGYPVEELCRLLHIAKSAYYKWDAGKKGSRIRENEDIAEKVEEIHAKSPDKGYRRINDDLRHDYGIHVATAAQGVPGTLSTLLKICLPESSMQNGPTKNG